MLSKSSYLPVALLVLSTLSGYAKDCPIDLTSGDSVHEVGRIERRNGKNVVISDGFLASNQSWQNYEFSFRARTPRSAKQVQIWASFLVKDRNNRYVIGLRGGDNNDVYMARYSPDGADKFLGVAPLGFKPRTGEWYAVRITVSGNNFQLYLNDEKLPRINVTDKDAPWNQGGIAVGGGWLPVEFSDVKVRELSPQDMEKLASVDKQTVTIPQPDREKLRVRQRAAYQPLTVKKLSAPREEISLNGNWLFMPEQNLTANSEPQKNDANDDQWHIMDVPNFWTPTLAWLHGETSFNYLPEGVSTTKGICDQVYLDEIRRLDSYTFDWRRTKSAWYRQHLNLPANIEGKNFELNFDAIAKIAEIWINGIKVGSHTGMFGEARFDITKAVRPGANLIAVHVVGQPENKSSNKIVGVAVSVEVTESMINSLPHGMYRDESSGIWQPAKLIVTSPVAVSDVFVQPKLDGADLNLDMRNNGASAQQVSVDYIIKPANGGKALCEIKDAAKLEVPARAAANHKLSTPILSPKLWSPEQPNLYTLEVRLKADNKIIDRYPVTFGFRTFTVSGGRFLLNGKPYWLRGGNHFPYALRPNDKALAKKFMQLAKQGNIAVTRSHVVPFNTTWLDAADKAGMAISYEGTWPWLLLNGEPPKKELLDVWHNEFAAMIKKYRNHPSIILWTVNNEMKFYFYDQDKPELLAKKWPIADSMVKDMRIIDPTRPIVMDSGYVRKTTQKEYDTFIQPKGFDDGDVDDAHRYLGWYDPSFFNFMDGQYGKSAHTPGRPLISQEMSTGYPRNDDAHPTRYYLFKHQTPQPYVGAESYENRDPAIFLKRQSFMTKELAEVIRRTNRDETAGVLHFAYLSWFKDVWNVKTIQPWQTYYSLKTALQPILISAELYGRHFYAGNGIRRQVCIINDDTDGNDLPAAEVQWEISANGKVLSQGSAKAESTPYYSNQWLPVDFKMPPKLPTPRTDGQLTLRLTANGKVLSQNAYDITIASRDWTLNGLDKSPAKIAFLGNTNDQAALLDNIKAQNITSLNELSDLNPDLLIINDLKAANGQLLKQWLQNGGKAFILNAKDELPRLFPDKIAGYRNTTEGEMVQLHIPESPVFNGLQILDLAWFELGNRQKPIACRGTYRPAVGTTPLAWQCDRHAYLSKPEDILPISGSPLLEIRQGQGRLIASEMAFEANPNDPIARRLFNNVITSLLQNK
jgi:hypothetical protein